MSTQFKRNEKRLVELAYHRNGISGIGFYVILFDWKDDTDNKVRRMVATVFDEQGACAVLDIAETAAGNIAFARGNSWRGDHFEDDCRRWIAEREAELNAKL